MAQSLLKKITKKYTNASCTVTWSETNTLFQVGDVIKLDQKVEEELNVYVGNMIKFKALPGSSSEQYAVKITEIIREEE